MADVAALRAAGLTDSQIVKVIEAEQAERKSARRERNRINQQNHRSRQRNNDDCQRVSADMMTTPSPSSPPSSSPPTPSLITTPTPSTSPSELRSAADAALGPTQAELEREFFRRGKQVCGKSAGGLLTELLKSKQHDLALARSVVEVAATKDIPREYVSAAIRAGPRTNGGGGFVPRPGSKEDRSERTAHAIKKLRSYVDAHADDAGGSGEDGRSDAGLLPFAQPPRS